MDIRQKWGLCTSSVALLSSTGLRVRQVGSKIGIHVRLAVPRELRPTSAAICVNEMPAVRVYATSRIPGPIVGMGWSISTT